MTAEVRAAAQLPVICAVVSCACCVLHPCLWHASISSAQRFGVSLDLFPGMGVGVLATDEVFPQAPVLQVPMRLILCRATLERHPKPSMYDALLQLSDEELLIGLVLLERARADDSFWAPYIRVLPKEVPVASSWTQASIAELQDLALQSEVAQRAAALNASILSVEPALRVALEVAGVHDVLAQVATSYPSMLWAASVVSSRALTIRGSRYLVCASGKLAPCVASTKQLAHCLTHALRPARRYPWQTCSTMIHHRTCGKQRRASISSSTMW